MKYKMVAFYVTLMVAIIIAMDLLFFRNRFWERLIANVVIAVMFVAFYLLKKVERKQSRK